MNIFLAACCCNKRLREVTRDQAIWRALLEREWDLPITDGGLLLTSLRAMYDMCTLCVDTRVRHSKALRVNAIALMARHASHQL